MSVGSAHRSNRSHSSSRPGRASSQGSSTKSPVYNVGRAPGGQTSSRSSSLSPPPSSRTGQQSRNSTSSNSEYGSGSGSRSYSGSRATSAPGPAYSDVDSLDLDAVLVRAAGEEPRRVIELLDKGADPHARSQRLSLTLMHRLVSNPKVQPELLRKIIRRLDERDVKTLVSAGNSYDITPLHFTVSSNLPTAAKIAEILLEHGANPAAIEGNDLKRQPLHIAALKGNKEVVEVLLKYKDQIDLDYRDSGESTALDNACWQGHMDVVSLLYEAGSGIHIRDDHGWTPLRSAAQYGHEEIVNYLLDKGADIGSADNEGLTSLHAAARDREIPVVETLLKRGAYINARDTYGCTPLDLVAWKGHKDVAAILVDNGAAVEVCDYEGLTPLMTACEFGSEEVTRFLVANGANIHRQDLKGYNALDKAVTVHGRIMHYLIMKGATSDKASEEEEYTPLMACIVRGYKDAAEKLLANGADPGKSDSQGLTCLMKAAHHSHVEIVEYLLDNYLEQVAIDSQASNGWTALIQAVMTGHEETVRLLLERNASVTVMDNHGDTALHHATESGMPKLTSLLLKHKAEVDAVDSYEMTPFSLLCATAPNRPLMPEFTVKPDDDGVPMPWVQDREPVIGRRWNETMNILLEADANPNWLDKEKNHPLHHCALWNDVGRVRILVDSLPPDVLYMHNNLGFTPLSTALHHKNPLTAKLLLERMSKAELGPEDDTDHEEKYLLWAAGSLETHEIALLLFAKSTKYQYDPKRDSWSVMDWAAYRGLPEVLWALLCSVEDTPETTRQRKTAMRIAKDERKKAGLSDRRPKQKTQAAIVEPKDRHRTKARLGESGRKGVKPRDPQEKTADPVGNTKYEYDERPNSPVELSPKDNIPDMKEGWPTLPPGDTEVPTGKRQQGGKHQEEEEESDQKAYKNDKWGLIVDMLRDPPIIQTSGPKESFEAPTDDGQSTRTLQDYEAAIIDFYAGGGGTGFLRRFRSLQETIYEDGPYEIMKQARETMQSVSSEMNDQEDESRNEQQKTYTKDDLTFTWVHLPANNVSLQSPILASDHLTYCSR